MTSDVIDPELLVATLGIIAAISAAIVGHPGQPKEDAEAVASTTPHPGNFHQRQNRCMFGDSRLALQVDDDINMRGSLWRVANEQMRSATSEEAAGIELGQ